MSGLGASGVACGAAGRTAAGPLFPRRLHLPPPAAGIAFQNKRTVYAVLMRAAAEALMTLAAGRLSARIGLIAVVQTWGQTLLHHPRVHSLVPGGGALGGQITHRGALFHAGTHPTISWGNGFATPASSTFVKESARSSASSSPAICLVLRQRNC
jgi:hypothetical protein